MLGIKNDALAKGGIIVIILVVLVGWLLYKNHNLVMRAMVQQETRWRTASFEEKQSQNYIIKYTEDDESVIPMVEAAAEQAYTSVSNVFGEQPKTKITLVVYPDDASLARSFGWDKNEKAMGVYWAGTIRILSPQAYLDGDMEEQFFHDGPMVHEFTHLMVDELSKGNYYRWWTEGVAQYVEKQITGFQFDGPGKGRHYYDLDTLEKKFDNLDQKTAYWESLQAVQMIVDNYGEEKVFEIINNLGQGKDMKQSVEQSLGIPYAAFEDQLYQKLQG